jgi:DNA polymerase-3 subunit gamma/tau
MAAQALYRKWRSQSFDDVVGQEHITVTLRNALREGRMSHAYLFTGPRGTGKTSTARILAKAINCLAEDPAARPCNACRICLAITEGRQLDLIEIDAASNRGIDEIRDLREKIGFRPNEARYKVYIIDEVHMLTKEAFNALLKTLEEPPPHAIFVLATTEPDRVPETVRSRCQRFDFRRIPTGEIVEHLAEILKAEGSQAETEALVAIARRSTGSMRDAVSLLDQLLSYGDARLTLARVEGVLGLVNAQTIGKLTDHLAAHDAAAGLALINRLVSDGVELGQLVDQIVAYLRGVLFMRVVRAPEQLDLPQDVVAMMGRQAETLTPAVILTALREFTEARAALRDQVPGVPQLPIEMAFLRGALAATVEAAPVMVPRAVVPASSAVLTVPTIAQPTAPPRAAPETGKPARQPESSSASAAPHVPAEQQSATRPLPVVQTAPVTPPADADLLSAAPGAWDPFITLAGQRCGMKVQAALRGVKRLDASGGTLIMQFSHTFSRDLVSQGENRVLVEGVWQEVLGRKVGVRCSVAGETPAAATTQSSPAGGATPDPTPVNDDEVLLGDARKLGAIVKPLM